METSERGPASSDSNESLVARIGEYERWVRLLDGQIRVLERERQKLAAVVNHADAGFLVLDPSLHVVWANDFCTARLRPHAGPAALPGEPCNRVLCGAAEICESCPAALAFRSRSVAHHETAFERDGQIRHLYATAMPILSPIGNVDQAMVMVQDVSGLEVLRRSEEALRESEGRLRMLVEQTPAVMWSVDLDLRFTSSVGAALAGLKLRPNQVVGMTLFEFFDTNDPAFPEIVAHRKAIAGESISLESDWGGRFFQTHLEPLRDGSGAIIGSVGAAFDVTERKEAERAQRQSEARKGAVLRTALDAIVGIDHLGRITEFNPAAEAMFGHGRNEVLGRAMGEILAGGILRHLESGEGALGRRVETTARRSDGSEMPVEIAVTRVPLDGPPSLMAYVRDLTDRKQAELALRERGEQLRQSQKLEAIGTLAGGVAHDFNNLLTCILGYAEILMKDAKPGDRSHRAADFIEKAARRGAGLTQQLLGFARKGKNQDVPVDLHVMIAEVIGLLGRTIDKNIHIVEQPAEKRVFVSGDPGQLQQMLLNLALNARDAMPGGGELTFATETSLVDSETAAKQLGMVPGTYVVLSVADTGCGIPEDVRERIFEPFFTTKEQGKGTGMGLAMAYGIIKSHGGFIYAESEVGRGTTMRVYLPGCEAPEHRGEAAPAAASKNGKGRILVVDDEEMVRSLAADYLQELGYDVVTAVDGQHAVERFQELRGDIDLVLLDLVMPRMGGRDCYHALRKMKPGVKTILSTGYGSNSVAQELLDEGMLGFIPKPYELLHLAEIVSKTLKR